jgi:hypothetical protein
MIKKKRTQGILILIGLLVIVCSLIVNRIMGIHWNSAPFLFTCLMIACAILIVSTRPVYDYMYDVKPKKRTMIISIIVFTTSVISTALHIIFFIWYGA